jgi:hypothetical protein
MKYIKKCNYKLIIILAIFILGLYTYLQPQNTIENMDSMKNKKRCPNMLVEKDGEILLYNSKLATVPGVNPIKFDNLEEYIEFYEWQKSQNIDCPVLYLQYTTDTQNNDLIQVKSSIFENNAGTPSKKIIPDLDDKYYEDNKMYDATKDSTPKNSIEKSSIKFNDNMYQGYDEQNQNIGLDTPLDKLFNSKKDKSANPMDTNWGGKEYSKSRILAGDYKKREVYKHNNPDTHVSKISGIDRISK